MTVAPIGLKAQRFPEGLASGRGIGDDGGSAGSFQQGGRQGLPDTVAAEAGAHVKAPHAQSGGAAGSSVRPPMPARSSPI